MQADEGRVTRFSKTRATTAPFHARNLVVPLVVQEQGLPNAVFVSGRIAFDRRFRTSCCTENPLKNQRLFFFLARETTDNRCFCDTDESDFELYGPTDSCDYPCAGDASAYCGEIGVRQPRKGRLHTSV